MNIIEHGYEELYDIKTDPQETSNLAGEPKYQTMLITIRNRYDKFKEEAR